jgi:hypothetical protein
LGITGTFGLFVLVQNRSELASEAGATGVFVVWVAAAMGLVAGLQLRKQWARWCTVALLALSSLASLGKNLSGGASGSYLLGLLVGASLSFLLCARLAFGKPAREYFADSNATKRP